MKVRKRSPWKSPHEFLSLHGRAFMAMQVCNVKNGNGDTMELPPDVIGVVFVYATREQAEARNPGIGIAEVAPAVDTNGGAK